MDEAINFQAIIFKVQTLADGGTRVSLDLPEPCLPAAMKLMEAKQRGALLEVVALPFQEKTNDLRGNTKKIHI